MFLVDFYETATTVAFKSYRSLRVSRSVFAAEVILFADLFNEAFAIKHTLKMATASSMQLNLLIDSIILFDIINKGSRIKEN